MIVKIVDKGDGFVMAKFEAESGAEHAILSMCPLAETVSTLELRSGSSYRALGEPAKATLQFGGFTVDAEQMMQATQQSLPFPAGQASQPATVSGRLYTTKLPNP